MRGIRYIALTLTVLAAIMSASVAHAERTAGEYNVKAAFLFNFVKFVQWPGASNVAQLSSINICILGENPFGAAAKLIEQGSTPKLKLNLQTLPSGSNNVQQCHILFISDSESSRLSKLIEASKSKPILTVGESPEFAQGGGMIQFVIADEKVKFIVNLGAAETAGLHVDSRLLEIAREVIR